MWTDRSKWTDGVRAAVVVCVALALVPTSGRARAWRKVLDAETVTTLYLEMDETEWNKGRSDQPIEGNTEALYRGPAWMHADGEAPILVTRRRKALTAISGLCQRPGGPCRKPGAR